jgi:hypothetical protein
VTYLASSAGALIVDRNTWHGHADQAWGTSRVWNSGSSFETDLANMTTDRNTWHSRADSAWGSSRVWSSGESWEAAYNRVLPPASQVLLAGGPWGNSTDTGVGYITLGSLSLDRSGYWTVWFDANANTFAGNARNYWRVYVGGSLVVDRNAGTGWDGYASGFWTGYAAAGTTIRADIRNDNQGYSGSFSNAYLRATFNATQGYPR